MVRRRAVLSVVAIAGAVALGTPRAAEPQPQAPAPLEDAGAVTSPETMSPPEELQSAAWPKPAAGLSASGDPELLLTFDDGPSPITTGRVLDILARYRVHAIFFLQGWRFERGDVVTTAALVGRMLREGHVIANHTIDHAHLCAVDDDMRTHQIVGARAILERVSGVPVPWFRAPYGERCPALEASLTGLGLRHFHWDIDPQEWRNRGPRFTAAKVIDKLKWLRGRAVLIMHDTKDATLVALPLVLDWIAFENRRREKLGLRPIRFVSGAQLAGEQVAPSVAWLRQAADEALAAVHDGLVATLP